MSLENVFYQPGITEMLAKKIEAAGLNFTRDYCFNNERTLNALVEQGYVVRPDFSNEHLRYRHSKIVRGIERLKDEVLIIPHNTWMFPEKIGSGRIVKKHSLLKLKRVRSIEEAVDLQIAPEGLREEAFGSVRIDDTYVGYDWKGIGENKNYKVVRLTDCINGFLLHENSGMDIQVRLKSYDNCENAIFRGAHAVVEVPSVSKEEVPSYRIRLSSLPVYNTSFRGRRKPRKLYFSTWFDLSSAHNCAKKDYAFQYVRNGREGSEELFDFHDIAAYYRVSEHKKRTGSEIQVMVNPFAVPAESAIEYANKLKTQVFREVVDDRKIRRRPLTQAEQEILLWKLVALRKSAFN